MSFRKTKKHTITDNDANDGNDDSDDNTKVRESPGGIAHQSGGIPNGIENHIEGVPKTNTEQFVKFTKLNMHSEKQDISKCNEIKTKVWLKHVSEKMYKK